MTAAAEEANASAWVRTDTKSSTRKYVWAARAALTADASEPFTELIWRRRSELICCSFMTKNLREPAGTETEPRRGPLKRSCRPRAGGRAPAEEAPPSAANGDPQAEDATIETSAAERETADQSTRGGYRG